MREVLMPLSPVSKIRVGFRVQDGSRSALWTDVKLAFTGNKVDQNGSAYSSIATSKGTVLIVDDDDSVRRALHMTLRTLGFSILEAPSGEEALTLARTMPHDVVLLDINMPGLDGLETCRELRRLFPRLAILMLTVRESEEDKVKALEAGADDYVTKPFHIRELTARVRSAVRRVRSLEPDRNSTIRIADIELAPARREVRKAGNSIHLTVKEFDLLHYLMLHAGLPISHGRLLSAVWGPEYGGEVEYLRTFMHQLRRKIEDDPAAPKYLLTDMKIGYRFMEGDLTASYGSVIHAED
jgi:two-component system, OmpR family, KDP operon response regulator KdpE